MNAMAAVGTVQRAPEIVIVNDGKPVEHVGASARGAKIAKFAIPAVIALVIGIAVGQVAKSANLYNAAIKDSRSILGDDKSPSTVKYLKRALSDLERALDERKSTGYKPDAEADKKLAELAGRFAVKTTAVFRTVSTIEPEVMLQVISFYAGVAEVKGMLDTHQSAVRNDGQKLADGAAAGAAAVMPEGQNAALAGIGALRYGALIQAPSDNDRNTDFGIKIVEIGQPYCGTTASTTGRCDKGEPASAYAYRTELNGPWSRGDLQTQGSDSVPAKKLVLLLPGGMRDAAIKGGEVSASEVLYIKRLTTVAERARKLIVDEANKVEQRLQIEANKTTRFSFFM